MKKAMTGLGFVLALPVAYEGCRRAFVNGCGGEYAKVEGCVQEVQQFGVYSDWAGMIDGRDIVIADRELQDYQHKCDATAGKCYQFQVEDIYPWLVRHEQAVVDCTEVKK